MKHHLSRKEMKRDEVREVLGRGVEYVRVHERTTLYVVGGLIGVLVIAAVVIFLLGRRESSASERLADALRIYGAKVDPLDPAPDDPEKPRFATDQERLDQSKAAFEKLASNSTDAGQVANVYLGEIAARNGDIETARRLWTAYLTPTPAPRSRCRSSSTCSRSTVRPASSKRSRAGSRSSSKRAPSGACPRTWSSTSSPPRSRRSAATPRRRTRCSA